MKKIDHDGDAVITYIEMFQAFIDHLDLVNQETDWNNEDINTNFIISKLRN